MDIKKILFFFMLCAGSSCLTTSSILAKPTLLIDQKAWHIDCQKNRSCRIQSHIHSKENIIVSSFSLLTIKTKKKDETKLIGIITLPLGIHIPSGITVNFDNKISVKANLLDCEMVGCRAIFTVEEIILDQMKKGDSIRVRMVDSQSRKGLVFQYSLYGFAFVYENFLFRDNKSRAANSKTLDKAS